MYQANGIIVTPIVQGDDACSDLNLYAEVTAENVEGSLPLEAISTVNFINLDQNLTYPGVLVSSSSNFWKFKLEELSFPKTTGTNDNWKVEVVFNESIEGFVISNGCQAEAYFDDIAGWT